MNYTELVATLESYAENYDTSTGGFVANIPVFVQNAEERIYNTVQIPALRRNVTGTLTSGNKYLSAPGDYLSTYSLAVINTDGEYKYLLNKDVNFIREAYPNPNDQGLPYCYAIFGPQYTDVNELSFMVGPTPDASYNVEMHYFYYPPSIVTAGTSWLGDNFESVLIYGSLLEAGTFMKSDPEIMAVYKDRYTEALALLKRLGDGLDRQDAYRSGQVRARVT
jgi:hypothetical protein